MRSLEPPRLARWMLHHFGCSPNNTAIAGDLDERYCRRRSSVWYWRQVIAAIVAGPFTEIRNNKSLTARSLVMGWGIIFLSSPVFAGILHILRGHPRGTGLLPESWTTVQWIYVRGWIVPAADSYVFGLIGCILAFGFGWLLGRLNRPHHAKAALIFVGSWLVCLVPAIFVFLAKTVHDWSSTAWRYDNPYFFVFGAAANVLAMLSTLLGGLWSGAGQFAFRKHI